MQASKACVVIIFAIFSAFIAIFLTGCRTYGTLIVSEPAINTREREVTQRAQDLQFLTDALNAPYQSKFAGAQDNRFLTGLQSTGAVSVFATAGSSTTAATPQALTPTSGLFPNGAGSMDLTTTAIDPKDQFDNHDDYREHIKNRIREVQLDDMHDRGGKTLYTLKFDTELIPGSRSDLPAVVSSLLKNSRKV